MKNILKKSQCIKSLIRGLFLLSTLALSGCANPNNGKYPPKIREVLKLSHDNRREIEKALDFFINQKDSLKIRSIFFLVGNMADKYSLIPTNEQDPFHSIILNNHIKETEDARLPGKSRIGMALDSLYKSGVNAPKPQSIRDIEVVTGDFLIKNVEAAFTIWQRSKKLTKCSFDDFCEYILPYRIENEPLSDWREQAYHKYSCLLDSIDDPIELAKAVIRVSGLKYNDGMNKYPFLPTFSELDHLHWGSCKHLATYLALSLRSIGIPSTVDVIPAWANRSGGHSWNATMNKDGLFEDVGFNKEGDNIVLHKIAKIYRTVYSTDKSDARHLNPLWKDITKEYAMPVSNLVLSEPGSLSKDEMQSLCIFNNKDWQPIAISTEINKKKITFRNVGRGILFGDNKIAGYDNEGKGIIYLPVSIHNGTLNAFTAPVILQENGDIHSLSPNHSTLRSISLDRKYPNYRRMAIYTEKMEGSCFEVSKRSNFSIKKRIYTITETPKHSISEIKLQPPITCRYIRYMPTEHSSVNISELQCYSHDGKLSGVPFASDKNRSLEELANICDGNIDTFYNDEHPNAYIGIDFGKEVEIDRIIYSPRTDENDVIPGEEYELFYWENRWVSLGRKKADSFRLQYDSVPDNSLLWLHNRTKGVEERIFTYMNNEQIWW